MTTAASADPPATPIPVHSLARFVTFGAVASLVNFAASIARNKALALTVGPDGIGVIGEAMQISSLAMTLAALAGGPVLGGAVASAMRDASAERSRTVLTTSLALGLGLGLVGAVAGVAFSPLVVGASWHLSTRFAVGIAVGASLVSVVPTTLATGMAARKDTFGATVAALVSSFFGAAVTVWLALTFGLVGALWSLVVTAVVTLVATTAFAWRSARGRESLEPILRWDSTHAKTCVTLGVAGLLGSLAQQGSLVAIRSTLEKVGGAAEGAVLNGQFQAAFGLEAQLFALGMTGLFAYYWPQFGTARNADETSAHLARITTFILKTFPPLVLAAVFARREIITILFSDRFHVATDVLVWYLAAATPKALLYTYGAPLYFTGKPLRFAALGVLGFGILGAVSVAATLRLGIVGVGVGQLAGVIIHLVLAMAFTRATIRVRLRVPRALVAVAFAGVVLALDWATRDAPVLRWSLFGVTLVWIGFNLLQWLRPALRK